MAYKTPMVSKQNHYQIPTTYLYEKDEIIVIVDTQLILYCKQNDTSPTLVVTWKLTPLNFLIETCS